MSEIQSKIRDVRQGQPTAAEALQAVSRLKADEVATRWNEFTGKDMNGVATFHTPQGESRIGGIRHHSDPSGLDSVEVWVGPQVGSPTYRLINPPLMVADPAGSEIVTETQPGGRILVRRFRVDPLHAIAAVIAARGSES